LATTADHHLGSTVALCPPRVRLDDGGVYEASDVQKWLYECWLDYWDQVDEARRRHKAKFAAYLGGDAFEGDHHRTMQIISRNPEAASYISDEVFGQIKQRKPIRTWVIRGTAAHVGGQGYSEEALARSLRASRDPDTGTWSSYERRFSIHGVEFQGKHHGRMGRLPWTRLGILSRVAVEVMHEFVKAGEQYPHVAIRSHNHKYGDTYDNQPVRLLATPCFQAKTEFGHKVSESLSDIGGFIVTVFPDGEYDVRHVEYQPALPTLEVVA
jgi:hypothetical protein